MLRRTRTRLLFELKNHYGINPDHRRRVTLSGGAPVR
jgi:hypothetical protein